MPVNNRTYVCVWCRTSRRLAARTTPPICCDKAMVAIDYLHPVPTVPKKRDAKGWLALKKQFAR